MLTHKIRDMPQHMFENKAPSLSGDDSTPLPPSLPPRELSSDQNDHLQPQQQQQQQQQPQQSQQLPAAPPQQVPMSSPHVVKQEMEPQPIKREPTETELPLPKRPPSEYSFLFSSLFLKWILFKKINHI